MRIQRKRVNDIVSKYNVEGITSNGWVHGNNACETQGFRLDKDDLVMYYVIFDYEDGKYSLAKRLTCSPQEPYFIFTNKLYYSDFKKVLIDFLEKGGNL